MADIRPVIAELKSKFPKKEQLLEKLGELNIPIDARVVTENDIVQSILKAELTDKTFLKLKEVLPNEELLDRVDAARKSLIKD
tara:strand:+ start:11142 stop:11390 length:249 start_codon:yes stop_codon:yes gene_type:complete